MSQAALSESFIPTIPMPSAEPPVEFEEIGSIGMLLKTPQNFARMVAQDRFDWQPIVVMLATSLGFYALYGLAMGVFAGGNSLWQATIKAPLVLFGSAAMTSPVLFLALCLSGVAIRFRQVVAMLTGVAGVSSAVMVGCAPLACLFGASTSNLQFMVIFHMIVWVTALGCGLRLMSQAIPGGFRECKLLYAWAAILLIVAAQTSTFVRPILGVAVEKKFREHDRKFFFNHFYASMLGDKPGSAQPVQEKAPAPPASLQPDYTPPPPSMAPMSN